MSIDYLLLRIELYSIFIELYKHWLTALGDMFMGKW